jgi:transmembrane sensor
MSLRLLKTKGMLRREAAAWLARMRGGADADTERRFQRWLDADPRHKAAFERVSRSYEQAGLLRHSTVGSAAQPAAAPAHGPARPRYALAAAAALVLLVPAAILVMSALHPRRNEAVMLSTRVGEIRSVKLADGSSVTLDTETSLEVDIGRSQRRARLAHGRARFAVTRSGEPFVIEAGAATVTSNEGIIDVERSGSQSDVGVRAGRAGIRGVGEDAPALALGPGEGASWTGAQPPQPYAIPAAPDWTLGMLEFDGTPLPSAIDLANRYSTRRIMLEGNMRDLRVTGAFKAGDTVGLAKALAAGFRLSLTQKPDGNFVLTRAE